MSDQVCYCIKNWDQHYESAETRKLKTLPRVLVPVKHDGKSYRRIMRQPNGPAIYAAWILLLQLAAKCPTRGVLADDDGPLTPEDMELKTDLPENLFREALEFLSKPEIGWISTQPVVSTSNFRTLPGESPDAPGDDGKSSGATEENGTEGKSNKTLSVPDRGALNAPGRPVRSGSRKSPSVFEMFFTEPERLRDESRLRQWVTWQAKQALPVIKNPTESDVLRVLATAKYAINEATDPVKMFVAMVGKHTSPSEKHYA